MPGRLMIAAPSGRSGKTTITTGICACLKKRGLVVQAFKKGPDYIDPSWLNAATGRPCRNLDLFMMRKDRMIKSFYDASQDAHISIIEANMGFYDGVKLDGSDSPANLARLIDASVILVVNCARMTRSVAALIQGYIGFEPHNNIKGIILNNVSGKRHEEKLLASIKRHCRIPVLGIVPRSPSLNIMERHLGLIPYKEDGDGANIISHLGSFIENCVDMDKIVSIAQSAPDTRPHKFHVKGSKGTKQKKTVKIGIFYDKAFSFYYPENLESLEKEGADLVPIDSMKDHLPSHIDGLYIGGGFPELYAREITKNHHLLMQIREAVENWMPVYCECAGIMFLSEGIKTDNGFFEMAGVIPSQVEQKKRPQGHGYMEVVVVTENPFFKKGQTIKGHEFHYSRLIKPDHLIFALNVKRGYGIDGYHDGVVYKNMFASYMHIHASGIPSWAKNFVNMAKKYKNNYFKTQIPDKKGVFIHVG